MVDGGGSGVDQLIWSGIRRPGRYKTGLEASSRKDTPRLLHVPECKMIPAGNAVEADK